MNLTGVIIAGGKSKRMGKNKLLLTFQNQTLLDKAVYLLENFTSKIIISTNNDTLQTSYTVLRDSIQNIGPLAGIYQALNNATTPRIIIIPVDMPLLNKQILQFLLNKSEEYAQINIFKTTQHIQMLVGIYHKSLLPVIEKQIEKKLYKLRDLLPVSSVNYIDGTQFEDKFINVNTPLEWQNLINKYER